MWKKGECIRLFVQMVGIDGKGLCLLSLRLKSLDSGVIGQLQA